MMMIAMIVMMTMMLMMMTMPTLTMTRIKVSPVSMLTTCSLQLLKFASRSLGDGRNTSSTSPDMMKMRTVMLIHIMMTMRIMKTSSITPPCLVLFNVK